MTPSEKAQALRAAVPKDGLFADKSWRVSPETLKLPSALYQRIVELGPRLHAFNKACNRLGQRTCQSVSLQRMLQASAG